MLRSATFGGTKVILDVLRSRKEVYNLRVDPQERNNLLASKDGRVDTGIWSALLDQHRAVQHLASDLPSLASRLETRDLERLRALGFLAAGSDAVDEESSTNKLQWLQRPMTTPDLDPLGFLGLEREIDEYTSRIDFAMTDWSDEQLLYGWRTTSVNKAFLMDHAGVRLARKKSHRRWRLVGTVIAEPAVPATFEIDVFTKGELCSTSEVHAGTQLIMEGELPAARSPFLRLDLMWHKTESEQLGGWQLSQGIVQTLEIV